MDQYSSMIQTKISKMENSLLALTNEILTAVKFLFQLRENSTQLVNNLNSIKSPEIYLKEFVNVNCFILKYMNFLTEVNCKFEMLEMSEENCNNLKSFKKSISGTVPKSASKADLPSSFESLQNINSSKDFNTFKKAKGKKSSKNSLNTPCKDKSHNVNNVSNHNGNVHLHNKKPKRYSNPDFEKGVSFKEKKSVVGNCSLQSQGIEYTKDSESDLSCASSSSSCIKEKPFQLITKDNLDRNAPTKLNSSEVKDEICANSLESENSRATPETESNKNHSQSGDIKPISIVRKLGEEYDVVIENIISPSEFYVSVKNNQSDLFVELDNKLKLTTKINNKQSSKRQENKKLSLSKELGNYALFYSKCDEMWYRAEIINWCLNFRDDFVTIFLLDCGETKCASIDDLQAMPECFKEYPAFAQRCHLHGVFPLDMDKNSKTLFWEKGSTEKMKSLTEKSSKIKIKVAPGDSYHSDASLPVTLFLVDQGYKSVNQLLVDSKFAVQHKADPKVTNGEKEDSSVAEDDNFKNWNPMKEDFESYQNCYDFDINDPAAIIYGYVGKDYDRICKHFAKTGYCFKGGACKKEHQKLDPLGFTTDQEEIYNNAFNSFPVPSPKTKISVQVTCLLSFNQFCCIPTDGFYSGEESLQSLLKFMNRAENMREMKKLLIPPSTGQIVIAKYSEDCSWYRARILDSQPEKDLYTVLFVDYGNKETLPLSSIRAIEARYLHLPFQGMKCFIYGVDRNPEVPSEKIMDYMNDRIYSGHITIEVVSKLPGEGTNLLVHVFDRDGRNIGNDLIAEKYGVSKSEILISDQSELIPG